MWESLPLSSKCFGFTPTTRSLRASDSMKHFHHSLMITRSASGYIFFVTAVSAVSRGELDVDMSTFSTDNNPPRKSSEEGWIQSEGVPATREWTRGNGSPCSTPLAFNYYYYYFNCHLIMSTILIKHVLQPCKFLVDTVFAKGMTVRQSKEELLPLLKEQCKLDLNIDRQV